MTSRLRAILGTSNRVVKKKKKEKEKQERPDSPRRTSSGGASHGAPSSSSRRRRRREEEEDSAASSSWSDSLRLVKPGTLTSSSSSPPPSATKATPAPVAPTQREEPPEEAYDYFTDPDGPLPDAGLATALVTDLTLRDVPQAMRYALAHMFTPLPPQPSSWGLGSARTAEVAGFRRGLPPVVTSAHLHALLRSPTAVEREAAELGRAGVVRKVVVPRRGGGGVVELLVGAAALDGMVSRSAALGDETKTAFRAWLAANPSRLRVPAGDVHGGGGAGLRPAQADQLVRAGFLTSCHDLDLGHVPSGFARPEDRATLLSLDAVSRAAAGSLAAVGGQGAIHSAGGSGGARSGGGQAAAAAAAVAAGGATGDLCLAVPGQGAFLKLEAAALAHLTALLGRSGARHGEATEALLRERWDGGVAAPGSSSRQLEGKRARREFAGVLPGRTRKWREFRGLAFDWVLHEAVGAGLVEVFETGCVGRGVRLLL